MTAQKATATFELQHPAENHVTARYGYRRASGVFVEIFVNDEAVLAYGADHTGYRGLEGALELLVEAEFFTAHDVRQALRGLQADKSTEKPLQPGITRAADVVRKLCEATGLAMGSASRNPGSDK